MYFIIVLYKMLCLSIAILSNPFLYSVKTLLSTSIRMETYTHCSTTTKPSSHHVSLKKPWQLISKLISTVHHMLTSLALAHVECLVLRGGLTIWLGQEILTGPSRSRAPFYAKTTRPKKISPAVGFSVK